MIRVNKVIIGTHAASANGGLFGYVCVETKYNGTNVQVTLKTNK